MKEIRVYVVNCDLYDGKEYILEMTNEQFMDLAEEQGTVYSLNVFETSYNNDWLDTINTYIRFIEVECAESINFEEWKIPTIKLNE
jgi:hypothetical protein